jgi:hypothetical protein
VRMKLIPIVYTAQAIVYTAQVCSVNRQLRTGSV